MACLDSGREFDDLLLGAFSHVKMWRLNAPDAVYFHDVFILQMNTVY